MRALVQRVSSASVRVDGEVIGAIDRGLLVFLGAGKGDTDKDLQYLVRKICGLRIFQDDAGKMNLSVEQTGGQVLVVSQFTLYGDCRKGRRPSFVDAMHPDEATLMVDRFIEGIRKQGLHVETGRFGADMAVELVNDGPVTLWIESPK